MKIRAANGNVKNPSLVVGVPMDMRAQMQLKDGDEVMWRLNDNGRWELLKMEVRE